MTFTVVTVKLLKIQTLEKIAVISLKFELSGFTKGLHTMLQQTV